MSTYYPQIKYPANSPTTTVNFTLAPIKKPGPYGIADSEAVGAVSMSLSGQRQTMFFREDTLFHLIFEDLPWADMSMWQSFIQYAHQGNSFLYYPDATGTAYDEYWLEDSGGSARASSPIDAWNPTMNSKQHTAFELILRKVPGGLTHG